MRISACEMFHYHTHFTWPHPQSNIAKPTKSVSIYIPSGSTSDVLVVKSDILEFEQKDAVLAESSLGINVYLYNEAPWCKTLDGMPHAMNQ